jgi:alpha-N-arabinofuranosidase
VDAVAARGTDGKLWLSLTNVDPSRPVRIEAKVDGAPVRSVVSGETLTAERVDSINTFESPNAVAPKPLGAAIEAGKIVVTLPPKSVSVFALQP